jgi:hypothetical protein
MERSWYNVTGTICNHLKTTPDMKDLEKYKYDSVDRSYNRVEETIQPNETYWVQLDLNVAAYVETQLEVEIGEIAKLTGDIRVKDAMIDEKNRVIAEKDAEIAGKDLDIRAKDLEIAEKDVEILSQNEDITNLQYNAAQHADDINSLNAKNQELQNIQDNHVSVKSMVSIATYFEKHYTEQNELNHFKNYASNTIQIDIDRTKGVELYFYFISSGGNLSEEAKKVSKTISAALVQYMEYLQVMKGKAGSYRISYPDWIAQQEALGKTMAITVKEQNNE